MRRFTCALLGMTALWLLAPATARRYRSGYERCTVRRASGRGPAEDLHGDRRRADPRPALRGVDLTVGRGEFFTNMLDRLGALGGTLRVDSAPGQGTRVTGSVPVRT